MVCLGNICRSPMAEGILQDLIIQHRLPWTVASAGTASYHTGSPPHKLAQKICQKHNIRIAHQRARSFIASDMLDFDKIYAMSADVLEEIKRLSGPSFNPDKSGLLLDECYPGANRSVPDPWYGTEKDYVTAFQLIEEACHALIRKHTFHTFSA